MSELITIENNTALLNVEVAKGLAEFERKIKEMKEKEDSIKESILAEMIEKDIKKIETEDIIITKIDATERESFDSKKFRADNPDLYDEYISFSPVKASVRIKVK